MIQSHIKFSLNRVLTLLVMGTFLLLSQAMAHHAQAQTVQLKKMVEVSNAYAYATSARQKNGAVFFEIKNLGIQHLTGADLILKSVSATGLAKRVELHTVDAPDDVMKMRKVEKIDLPAGQTVTLEPAGQHVMLMGLKKPLEEGTDFPVLIWVSDGHGNDFGNLAVRVKVIKPGTTMGAEDHEHDHVHDHAH